MNPSKTEAIEPASESVSATQTVADPSVRRPRLILAFVFASLLCLAAVFLQYDLPIAKSLSIDSVPGDLKKLVHLSEAFAHGFGVVIILSIVFALSEQPRRIIPRLIGCVLTAGLLAQILKVCQARFRPHYFNNNNQYDALDSLGTNAEQSWGQFLPILNDPNWNDSLFQSFPSAHSATAFSLAVGLSWAFPKGRYIFFTLATLSGYQRIACDAHWPSDVVVGSLVGLTCGIFLCYPQLFWNHSKANTPTEL